ncbi:unnamed protein product, partial [Amoebophrya sp. A25]
TTGQPSATVTAVASAHHHISTSWGTTDSHSAEHEQKHDPLKLQTKIRLAFRHWLPRIQRTGLETDRDWKAACGSVLSLLSLENFDTTTFSFSEQQKRA